MNPERLLGHLLMSGLRGGKKKKKGLGFGTKATLGMGALGIAMAAYEHFATQSSSAAPTSAGAAPPPLPPQSAGGQSSPTPPPPPVAPSQSQQTKEDAELLVRAMIAAANADGLIDKAEEQRILDAARSDKLDDDELEFLESEMHRPRTMFEIVAGATTPDLQRQVYAASCLAIHADTEAEQNYLKQLASSLHLTAEQVAEIESDVR